MLNVDRSRGFTLVEVMTAVTILAILVALGVPSFSTYMQSAKLSTAANTYQNALQVARTEAIRRNLPVQFAMTSTSVGTSNIENNLILDAGGSGFVVRYFDPTSSTFKKIDSKSATESTNSPGSAIVAGAVGPAGFDGSITFNGFGATAGVYNINLSNPAGGACAPTGPMRCPRIRITAGGQISNCDPVAVAGDTRACPP